MICDTVYFYFNLLVFISLFSQEVIKEESPSSDHSSRAS